MPAQDDAATALTDEEQLGLKLSWVATRADLNAAEAENIGCDPTAIPVRVRDLCGNAPYWFVPGAMPADEAACRFHHELVSIHPFANGNGRHARLATDLLMRAHGLVPFTWGASTLVAASATRGAYVAALRSADREDFGPLVAFVRS